MSTPSREAVERQGVKAHAAETFTRALRRFVDEAARAADAMPRGDAQSQYHAGAINAMVRSAHVHHEEYRELAALWGRIAAFMRRDREIAAEVAAHTLAEEVDGLCFGGKLTSWAEGGTEVGGVLYVNDLIAVRVLRGKERWPEDEPRENRPGWAVFRYEAVYRGEVEL